ncbi:nitroreductase family protein [Evansella tamaricis]|nr:nitroreductase family protein [Evansella tamaricis]
MENQSSIDIMSKRYSVRTFETTPIEDVHHQYIKEYINNESNLIGPFGNKSRIEYIPVINNVTDKGIKLGTYGFIKNPQAYLVGITENKTYPLIDFAYVFQKLLLQLEKFGIGNCWMGGTFSRKSFQKELVIGDGNFIPGISPIGYPRIKQRLFDKTLRKVVRADNKKSWEKLFFHHTFEMTLERNTAEKLEIPIEMVRIGPSASNKQPWRLVLSKDKTACHFYIEHTPNYSSSFGYDMQLLDMGIAMCQFHLACSEIGIDGYWVQEDPNLTLPTEQTEYLFSWKCKR